jgi:3-deoxy-D-manno-octulosonic-acid transferase
VTRTLYTVLITLVLPLIALRLWWRARRQPEYLQHVGERFGRYAGKNNAVPLIWLHAVSVGETRAAEPLLRALREHYPQHRLLLTHMTPTGRETGVALFGDDVLRCYLPYDYPRAVARFLAHYKPSVGVLMETEIWPNLVHACQTRAIPLYLVNARLSEKSFARYQRVGALTADTVRALTAIAAQSADDARRFEGLGAARVSVTGNLKFDVAPSVVHMALGEHLRESFEATGKRRVLLAASTREGEELLFINNKLHEIPNTLLVIVPRHPQRFDDVAALLDQHHIAYQRRSANEAVRAETRVLLGDSMGEMVAYYAACDVAFIGGSLLPFGGQNLIEACAVGKPVLIGTHTHNFAEATERAVTAGAAVRVMDGADLLRKATALLDNPKVTERMSAAALAFAGEHRGATQKLVELIRF